MKDVSVSFLPFLGEESEPYPDKRVSIIPVPYGGTVSWMGGTEQGPGAIIAASPALEVFDDELLQETVSVGIATLPALDVGHMANDEVQEEIGRVVATELARERLPVVIGGEHSITPAAVKACTHKYPDLHVVQIDAHLDLRENYEGSRLNHACAMRRIDDHGLSFTQVGIRSFSAEEWEFVRQRGWQPFTMKRIRREADWVTKVCQDIAGPVYLSVDVDGLDPSIMPATGTPEPDGLLWQETISLLRGLAKKPIIGMDFVEFAPATGAHHAAFTVAKLIYRTLGYIFEPFFTKK